MTPEILRDGRNSMNDAKRHDRTTTLTRREWMQTSAVLAVVGGMGAVATIAAEPQWETAATVTVGGLQIALSKPRLVARSAGYMWFPTMTRLSGGELFLNLSTNLDAVVADRTSTVTWSADDGLTWSELTSIDPKADLYTEAMLRL
jgi:hypothetical protein